jgi:hypothetical protein
LKPKKLNKNSEYSKVVSSASIKGLSSKEEMPSKKISKMEHKKKSIFARYK